MKFRKTRPAQLGWFVHRKNGTMSTLSSLCASSDWEDPCPSFGIMLTLSSSSTDETAATRSTAVGLLQACLRAASFRVSPQPASTCRLAPGMAPATGLGVSRDECFLSQSLMLSTPLPLPLTVPPTSDTPMFASAAAGETERAPLALHGVSTWHMLKQARVPQK